MGCLQLVLNSVSLSCPQIQFINYEMHMIMLVTLNSVYDAYLLPLS